MGRQIAIVTQRQDEQAVLRKIAELAGSELRVFRRGVGKSPDSLWIDDWSTTRIRDDSYGVWPTEFRWRPRYRQIKPPCVPQVRYKWYVCNESAGPVIEFSRHDQRRGTPGRLYWSKGFAATTPLGYDVAAFDQLVTKLWRWIRQVSVPDGEDPHRPFILPHAFRRRGRRAP
jgi:hypothetical protein